MATRREALEARRRVANRQRERMAAPRQPRRVEAAYAGALERMATKVHRAIAEELRAGVRGDARDPGDPAAWDFSRIAVILQGLFFRVAGVIGAQDTEQLALSMFEAVTTHATAEQSRILGIPIQDALTPALMDAQRAAVEANARQIRGILDRQVAEVMRAVMAAVQGGTRAKSLEQTVTDLLPDLLSKNKARARLVARDQVLTANAAVTRVRQVENGVTHYRWVYTHDERVRPRHKALGEGVPENGGSNEYSWDEKPRSSEDNQPARFNHPGEDFQCRCTAVPVIPRPGTFGT